MKKRRGCLQWGIIGIVAMLIIGWLASLGGGGNQGAQRAAPTIAIVAATATAPATNTPEPPTATPPPTETPTITPSPTPTLSPTPCNCSGNVYNCDDFTHYMNEAQACYAQCIAQGVGDIHELDRDGDGNACEWKP